MARVDDRGPFVSFAVFAVKPQPTDRTIRLAGEIFPVAQLPAALEHPLFVGLTGVGTHRLTIILRREDGSEASRDHVDVTLPAPPKTLRMEIRFPIIVGEPGLYRVDLESAGRRLTRIFFSIDEMPARGPH